MENVHESPAESKRNNSDSTGKASWLRLWHDMPTDPKFRVVSKKSGRPLAEVVSVFVMMLTCASAASDRGSLDGWSDEDVAAALDLDSDHVTAIRSAMQGKMLDGDRLTGWERRQPKREDRSTERVRAHRERNKTPETISETQMERDETQRNAPEERREEERRYDTQPLEQEAARDAPVAIDGPADDLSSCKAAFNGTTEAMLREIERAMGSHADRQAAESWLATMLRINGPEPVAQAFAMLATKRAENSPIGRILPWWSKTAASLKAKPQTPAKRFDRNEDPYFIGNLTGPRNLKPAPGSDYVPEVASA